MCNSSLTEECVFVKMEDTQQIFVTCPVCFVLLFSSLSFNKTEGFHTRVMLHFMAKEVIEMWQ